MIQVGRNILFLDCSCGWTLVR